MSALSGTNEYMVVMNDLHEIRGYNRLAKMASARFLVFLQDDDAPQNVCRAESGNCVARDEQSETLKSAISEWLRVRKAFMGCD